MQNYCAVPNCPSRKSDSSPLFRFPLNKDRCKTWLEKCQRPDLEDKPPDQLFKYYRLCGKHFDSSSIDANAQMTVLKDDGVPTVFDVTSPPPNGQAKRGKETVKEDDTKTKGRKRFKKTEAEEDKEEVQPASEEDKYKEYLKSLFEVLVLLEEQNIPLTSPGRDKPTGSGNYEVLLEYRKNCGDEELKRRFEASQECCSAELLDRLMEVCERCLRRKLTEEVNQNGFFSLLTDDPVKISGEWCVPVFVRYVDQSNLQRERFLGFLPFEGEGEALAEALLSEMTEKWGLKMEQCRAQAHCFSGTHFRKVKTFAAKVTQRYPSAVLTFRSTCGLNMSLARGMAAPGVQLVLGTLKKIESFFGQSPSPYLELAHAISIFYSEEKANDLKEVCRSDWTGRHDAFEVAVEILEPLLLCVDSVHDNEDLRWSDQVTHDALEISKALTDFEFLMALVVLKNTMTLTRAFGKNIQGEATETYFAANSLKGVLHSLKEVSENMDVYHEFWNEEAVNLAATLEIPVRVPRSFLRKHQSEPGSVRPDVYYKEHLSVPVVNHVIREIGELFGDDHLKALRCLSLVPAVIEQHKSIEPEEENMQVFKNDMPNAGTLSAELHCWWVKWSKRGKGETLPSSLQETLRLADLKFFPNMLAVLRLVGVLPALALEGGSGAAFRRFRTYVENMARDVKSNRLALLNINGDIRYELDSMVEVFMESYPVVEDTSSAMETL